jgi:hypothetical protein
MRVANGIPLRSSLFLPVDTVNSVQTLKDSNMEAYVDDAFQTYGNGEYEWASGKNQEYILAVYGDRFIDQFYFARVCCWITRLPPVHSAAVAWFKVSVRGCCWIARLPSAHPAVGNRVHG